MKPLRFVGNSLKCLREFPDDAKRDAGCRATAKRDTELAKSRYAELTRGER